MTTTDVTTFHPDRRQLICRGEWCLATLHQVQITLADITWPTSGELVIEGKSIKKMDSAGAWLLNKLLKQLIQQGLTVRLESFQAHYHQLLTLVTQHTDSLPDDAYSAGLSQSMVGGERGQRANLRTDKLTRTNIIAMLPTMGWMVALGQYAIGSLTQLCQYLAFVGQVSCEIAHVVREPTRIRWRALTSVLDKTGCQALPIIGLLSLMIGVVIAYQMGVQLRTYGANIYIVDLLGLSILREFGPLITAIMVAGRTGSAFTAQLGMMKINQEIDALNTMGVTPAELLLLPRIVGLLVALPLLTIWSDIFGVLGGMWMADNMLGMTWYDFLHRFEHVIPLRALLIGLGKAPVFALIISSVGCFQGLQVSGSADSVGRRTTRSVVLAIFFIIIADAIFSIIFSKLRL